MMMVIAIELPVLLFLSRENTIMKIDIKPDDRLQGGLFFVLED
jgi:hypothetical protein